MQRYARQQKSRHEALAREIQELEAAELTFAPKLNGNRRRATPSSAAERSRRHRAVLEREAARELTFRPTLSKHSRRLADGSSRNTPTHERLYGDAKRRDRRRDRRAEPAQRPRAGAGASAPAARREVHERLTSEAARREERRRRRAEEEERKRREMSDVRRHTRANGARSAKLEARLSAFGGDARRRLGIDERSPRRGAEERPRRRERRREGRGTPRGGGSRGASPRERSAEARGLLLRAASLSRESDEAFTSAILGMMPGTPEYYSERRRRREEALREEEERRMPFAPSLEASPSARARRMRRAANDVFDRLYDEADRRRAQLEKEREASRRAEERRIMEHCTFAPHLPSSPQRRAPPGRRGSVEERSAVWRRRADRRVETLRRALRDEEDAELRFAPDLSRSKRPARSPAAAGPRARAAEGGASARAATPDAERAAKDFLAHFAGGAWPLEEEREEEGDAKSAAATAELRLDGAGTWLDFDGSASSDSCGTPRLIVGPKVEPPPELDPALAAPPKGRRKALQEVDFGESDAPDRERPWEAMWDFANNVEVAGALGGGAGAAWPVEGIKGLPGGGCAAMLYFSRNRGERNGAALPTAADVRRTLEENFGEVFQLANPAVLNGGGEMVALPHCWCVTASCEGAARRLVEAVAQRRLFVAEAPVMKARVLPANAI